LKQKREFDEKVSGKIIGFKIENIQQSSSTSAVIKVKFLAKNPKYIPRRSEEHLAIFQEHLWKLEKDKWYFVVPKKPDDKVPADGDK
jgi:hypothetical protein